MSQKRGNIKRHIPWWYFNGKGIDQGAVEMLFNFLRKDTIGQRHMDMFTMLICTGVRISEFADLTIRDIVFTNNVIHVNKQIIRLVGRLAVTPSKSENGTEYSDDEGRSDDPQAASDEATCRQKGCCDR